MAERLRAPPSAPCPACPPAARLELHEATRPTADAAPGDTIPPDGRDTCWPHAPLRPQTPASPVGYPAGWRWCDEVMFVGAVCVEANDRKAAVAALVQPNATPATITMGCLDG